MSGGVEIPIHEAIIFDLGTTNGELVINPDEAVVVRWIFEHYLSGDSLGKIAAGLEKRGTV